MTNADTEKDTAQTSAEHDNPIASLLTSTVSQTTVGSVEHEGGGDNVVLPTKTEILSCQVSSWYPTFSNLPADETVKASKRKHRSNVTIASIIIDDLPVDFQEYLLSDGIRLPLNATNVSSCAPPEGTGTGTRDNGNDSDDEFWSSQEPEAQPSAHGNNDEDSDSDEHPPKQFCFPILTAKLQAAIKSLGGSVVPKLNWSAPKDATWMNGGTLKCKTPGDVYLLLKSSDFCLHDVLHAFDDCKLEETADDLPRQQDSLKLQIALRKWCNLHPSMEFRCFVRNHHLVAMCQRNHTQHYPHLLLDQQYIRQLLFSFFTTTIQYKFANSSVSNYVVDVYLDQKRRVWIVDFNPWSQSTDSLLWQWSELATIHETQFTSCQQQDHDVIETSRTTSTNRHDDLGPYDYNVHDNDDSDNDDNSNDDLLPPLRLVMTENQVRADPLASYRAPIDTIDIASMTGGDVANFQEFMAQCFKPS